MNWLYDMPLKRKLTLVILLTCSAVLLLACGVLAAYQMFHFRRTIVRDTTVLADVLAKNTQAALAFQDENNARQTLLALQAEPNVAAACLYTANGNRFATYARTNMTITFPAKPAEDGHQFERGHLVLFRPVILNDRRIGTIYLQTDLQGMYEQLRLFSGIALLVLFGSVLVAFVLSSRLQRPISQPILALAETVRLIAQHKDYTIRVPRQGRNETGLLTDAFNQLLVSIEERGSALSAANKSLRGEIAERKDAEVRVQSQLARLELLHRITRAISERQDLQSIFQVVIRTLEEHLPIDFSCVCLYEAGAHTLTVTSVGVRSEALAMELALTKQARVDIDQNGLTQCVNGRLVYEPDISQSEFPFPQRLARGGLRSFVAAPLLAESQVFGVLIVGRRQPHGFSSGECEFLRQLSEHTALAAHQAQLYNALQLAYDDLRQTQQAVMQQERLRALGEMASGIAHDINNSLSPVMLYTGLLLEQETSLSPASRGHLETIQRAVTDVAETIARLKEFYRQHESQLTLASVQLNHLAQQVVDLTRARWNDMPLQRGVVIQMQMDLMPDLPPIMGAESEIREALINLVFNAVDAMPKGGTLTLRTEISDKNVRVEIADTGTGMDEETRRRCLEPFFTTKGERGTGLGLAMVYGIVRRHSADLEIESKPGKGTTISLIFLAASSIAGGSAKSPATTRALSRLRLLVVDDDPLLLKALRDILEADGHVVTAMNGGQTGIDAFQTALASKEPFAAVITDLGMPYVDGRAVAGAVKAASPATPVILLTGWGKRITSEGDIPPHVNCVLSKPPKPSELREALAQMFRND